MNHKPNTNSNSGKLISVGCLIALSYWAKTPLSDSDKSCQGFRACGELKELSVEKLTIVDKDGIERARMSVDSLGAVALSLLDKKGKRLLELECFDGEPKISLNNLEKGAEFWLQAGTYTGMYIKGALEPWQPNSENKPEGSTGWVSLEVGHDGPSLGMVGASSVRRDAGKMRRQDLLLSVRDAGPSMTFRGNSGKQQGKIGVLGEAPFADFLNHEGKTVFSFD